MKNNQWLAAKSQLRARRRQRKSFSGLGFSNQTALIIIAVCYPLGIVGLSSLYRAVSQNPNGWSPPQIAEQIRSQPLTESEAKSVIEAWWAVRPRIFASPYDATAASVAVAKGPLWSDLNKSDGPVAWLRNNNQYYTYHTTTIQRVVSFDPQQAERPSIVVTVDTQDTLHGPGIYKPSSASSNFRYIFAREGGRWKIWNYEKL